MTNQSPTIEKILELVDNLRSAAWIFGREGEGFTQSIIEEQNKFFTDKLQEVEREGIEKAIDHFIDATGKLEYDGWIEGKGHYYHEEKIIELFDTKALSGLKSGEEGKRK